MAEVNQLTVKTVNIHQSKIDVVKFDGTNNFDMWRCEVMYALTVIKLGSVFYMIRNQRRSWRKIGIT